MQLRDYQEDIANKAVNILQNLGIVYLALEMRVGKTLIAMTVASIYGAKRVLFTSKKKALSSIKSDYEKGGFDFDIDICNYEQLHKYSSDYDLVIVDEAHSFSAFPKASNRTKELKKIIGGKPMILLSGTPTPESYSQIYHQLWLSSKSPFVNYKNFYAWSKEYVTLKDRYINGIKITDYSQAKEEKVKAVIHPYMITFTQEEAGFEKHEVEEAIDYVAMRASTQKLIDELLKNEIYTFPDGKEVVCDSAVKLQNKIHQLSSGTIITEEGRHKILDVTKAKHIKEKYGSAKIAIFYQFQAEADVLKYYFPNWTEEPFEFNERKDKVFISQIQSGSMGVNLSTADFLIFYNINFSATLYWQARARIQDFKRKEACRIIWVFNEKGIEDKIMKAVQNKKQYTVSYFRRDYGVKRKAASEENTQLLKGAAGILSKNYSGEQKRSA